MWLIFLMPLLISCSYSQCGHVGPKEISVPTVPVDQPFKVTYNEKNSIIEFNKVAFRECAALSVKYDGVDYGIYLLTEYLFLPNDKEGDTHSVYISCVDKYTIPVYDPQMYKVTHEKTFTSVELK